MFKGKIVRLSHILTNETPSFGNRDRIKIEINSSISKGNSSNTSIWNLSNNHIGTHIDFPKHFCEEGLKTCDVSESYFFFHKIQLIDIPCFDSRLISIIDLKKTNNIDPNVDLLLIRSGYERYRTQKKYWDSNPGIDAELGIYLRDKYPKLRCLGLDFISLTSWKHKSEGKESHKTFLCPHDGRPITVIEDMSLDLIDREILWVVVAPLFVKDGNGGPVTIFAGLK